MVASINTCMSEVGFWIPFHIWLVYLEQALYIIVRRQIKSIIVFHIELRKNIGPVTDCKIFSSYFSCFGLLADTSWFKVNDGGSLLYQVFRVIL